MILTISSSRDCEMTFFIVKALQSFKFWKSDNGAISWTEWNTLMTFCIHIDIDKMNPMRLSNDIWDWLSFCRGSQILEKVRLLQNDIYHRSRLCRVPNSEKGEKLPYLLNWVEHFDRLLCKYRYWQDLTQEIAKWYFSSVEVLPSSKFWKSENGPISWTEWNIVIKFCIQIGIDKM